MLTKPSNSRKSFGLNNSVFILAIAFVLSLIFSCDQNKKAHSLTGKWIPYKVTGNNEQYNVNETKLAFKWMQYDYAEFDGNFFSFFNKKGDRLGSGSYVIGQDSIYTFISREKNDSSSLKIRFVNKDIFKAIDSTRGVVVWFKRK